MEGVVEGEFKPGGRAPRCSPTTHQRLPRIDCNVRRPGDFPWDPHHIASYSVLRGSCGGLGLWPHYFRATMHHHKCAGHGCGHPTHEHGA